VIVFIGEIKKRFTISRKKNNGNMKVLRIPSELTKEKSMRDQILKELKLAGINQVGRYKLIPREG
jgi:hypothetical protein